MSRSKWKNPPLDCKAIKQIKINDDKPLIKRSCKIMPNFLGYAFKIHNGKAIVELLISKDMIGHKFGEFVFTRMKCIFKNKKNKKKKKKLNKK
jgi:small subunit ribosomal protein S19